MVAITRLRDGAAFPTLAETKFQALADSFGFSREQTGVLGTFGEFIQTSSVLNNKLFSLTWVSVDTTGEEQRAIRNFFVSGELYRVEDETFKIPVNEGTVNDVTISDDFKIVTVYLTSRFGSFVSQTRTILNQQSIAAGGNSVAFSGSFTNNSDTDALIQLTLEANENTIWKAGTQVGLTQLPFVIGVQDEYGSYILTQKRKSVVIDSSRVILGSGYLKYGAQRFAVRPGQTKAIALAAITNPLTSASVPWSLKLETIATKMLGE